METRAKHRNPVARVATLFLLCLMVLPAGIAAAQQQFTHDGFFLQMDLGVGGLASEVDSGLLELRTSGLAGQFSVAVGGAVAPNLLLAGQLWGATVSEPKVELNGVDLGTANADLSLTGIGLNMTYYFMPANVYLSFTPSITKLTVESNGNKYDTDNGLGVRFAVGKEWWVSPNWALGLNGQVAISSNKDQGDTWNTAWLGIAFSLTFN